MARVALPDWLDDDSVTIAVASTAYPEGRDYTFASPDIDTGLRIAALAEQGVRVARVLQAGEDVTEADVRGLQLDDDQEVDLYRLVMGDTYRELQADGVSWVRMQRLGRYLFLLYGMGEEAATMAVDRAGEAPRPPRRERRAKSKRTSTDSPAGSRTRRPKGKG